VLIEKLKIFPEEITERNRIARRYSQHLADVVRDRPCLPTSPRCGRNTPSASTPAAGTPSRGPQGAGDPDRDLLPKPLHRLEAYRHFPADPCGLPVCDLIAEEVISLPMHAYLDDTTQDRIIAAVRRAVGG